MQPWVKRARKTLKRVLPHQLGARLWDLSRAFQRQRLRGLHYTAARGPAALKPWAAAAAKSLEVAIRPRLVPPDDLQTAMSSALKVLESRTGRDGVGDYFEFGVYNGTSMACMYRALEAAGQQEVRLFGFDSFEGLPDEANDADEGGEWRPGQFASSQEFATTVLRREGVDMRRVQLIPGWFDDTLTPRTVEEHGLVNAGVLMVDCDLYSSTRTALDFAAPLVKDAAVVFFDDWHWHSGRSAEQQVGERRAFEEFLASHTEFRATPLPELRYTPNAQVFLLEHVDGVLS